MDERFPKFPDRIEPGPGDAGVGLAEIGFGLATLTMVLFPFLIPGLVILALLALPALPLLLLAAAVALPVLMLRAMRRRPRNRTPSQVAARRPAAGAAPARQPARPRVRRASSPCVH